jgi:hypothetical protein
MSKDPNEILKSKSAGEIAKEVADLKIISRPKQLKEIVVKETTKKTTQLKKEVLPIFKSRTTNNTESSIFLETDLLNELKKQILNENTRTGANIKLKHVVNNIIEAYINSNK